MARRPTARELEHAAAARGPVAPFRDTGSVALTPEGEALAMLRRRGLQPRPWPPDLLFPASFERARQERLSRLLDHYAFRLFLRGAIQRPDGFAPGETTRYVEASAARRMASDLEALGLAERAGRGRYRLVHAPRSFGGTLEWYVARELRWRLGFDTLAGQRFAVPGVGGDLDVVAVAEGRLVAIELKSSPPRQIAEGEIAAFFDRIEALRPDLALFVVDTALRLGDKIVPMMTAEIERRRARPLRPRRLARETWVLTPRLYAVGAKGDLLGNLGRAISSGLHALGASPIGA